MKEILLRAVKRLPEQERVATILFYMGEYSHAEIVEFLSIPLSTVNNRLRTARRHLKERLVKNMVCQTLSQQQPSRNDKFVKEVLFKAIEQVAPERVSEIFNENPMLINATDSKGRTPIEALTSQRSFGWDQEGQKYANQRSIYQTLVSKGGTPDLAAAIKANDLPKVKAFVKANPDLIHQQFDVHEAFEDGLPLSLAANYGRLEIMECLISAGADINADNGQALARAQDLPVWEWLVAHGANVNPSDPVPLNFACNGTNTIFS